MGALLDSLCQVQKIERRLHEIRVKQEALQRQVRFAEKQVEDHRTANQSHAQQVTQLQMEIDRLDLQIKSSEESINKHRQALNAAKSNKEYAAILTALNTEKVDSTKHETRMLTLMSQLDALREQSAALDEQEARLVERVKHHQQQIEAFRTENRATIDDLERQREQAADDLPPSALATFNRIAERHDGEGLVAIERTNPRSEEYRCSGCNMTIPLEQVNRLRGTDELQICNSCGRILCLESQASIVGA